MPDVHFSDAPGHIGWSEGDLQTLRFAFLEFFIDVMDKDRHPHAFVGRFATVRSERGGDAAVASAALRAFAQKNLAFARAHGSEDGRLPPVPQLSPAEFSEPIETIFDIRDVEDRGNVSRVHESNSLHYLKVDKIDIRCRH